MFENYINKKVKIITKAGTICCGILIAVSEDFVTIEDRFVGKKVISTEVIGEFSGWGSK
ncbi:hypothetical protein HOC62_03950 [Candidatus Woesearchaeota archaeon]|jgi:hypothetical protein|nr:hypothetical protein [Candidatus Woesearchaeota archaeon]